MNYKLIKEINEKLKEPFKLLRFEEKEHKYWVEGDDRLIKSVSTHLKHFYEEFDTNLMSERWATERGMNAQLVRDAWIGEGDIANNHGTNVHLVGENYIKHKYFKECEMPKIIDKQSLGCIQFIDDLPDYLIPVATELQMYSPKHWYSGTADIIMLNQKTGKYIIGDWKTNKSLTDVYKKPPLINVNPDLGLIQDNFGKYSLQFSFYQILLEEAGFEVGGRVLIWLNEDKKNKKLYKTFQTLNLTSDIRNFLSLKIHLK